MGLADSVGPPEFWLVYVDVQVNLFLSHFSLSQYTLILANPYRILTPYVLPVYEIQLQLNRKINRRPLLANNLIPNPHIVNPNPPIHNQLDPPPDAHGPQFRALLRRVLVHGLAGVGVKEGHFVCGLGLGLVG